jgi:hypothetical protein
MQSECIRCKHSQHMPRHGDHPAVRTKHTGYYTAPPWCPAGELGPNQVTLLTSTHITGYTGYYTAPPWCPAGELGPNQVTLLTSMHITGYTGYYTAPPWCPAHLKRGTGSHPYITDMMQSLQLSASSLHMVAGGPMVIHDTEPRLLGRDPGRWSSSVIRAAAPPPRL